jgi:hypothetical protein
VLLTPFLYNLEFDPLATRAIWLQVFAETCNWVSAAGGETTNTFPLEFIPNLYWNSPNASASSLDKISPPRVKGFIHATIVKRTKVEKSARSYKE